MCGGGTTTDVHSHVGDAMNILLLAKLDVRFSSKRERLDLSLN
jgi:hypothetical protein